MRIHFKLPVLVFKSNLTKGSLVLFSSNSAPLLAKACNLLLLLSVAQARIMS